MMASNEVLRCAIYARKSVEDIVAKDFSSIDAQREACENYIRSQVGKGWEIIPTHYDDNGYSGGNMNRPALNQLLYDCREGKIDIVVIYKLDRLSRSLCDFAELNRIFEACNVSFCSITQEINTNTSSGKMMLNILMTFAEFERSIITERIRDKISASKKRGDWTGGSVPFGYKVIDKKLVTVPEEVPVVKRIFKRYAEIQSPKQVVRELNQDGILTNRKKPWTLEILYRLLHNYTYIGKILYKGEVYKGKHERIISDALFEEVQRKLEENRKYQEYKGQMETMAPLRGLLYCGHCQGRMTPSYSMKDGKRKYTYYVCSKNSKRGESLCPVDRIPGMEIEQAVLDNVKNFLSTPTFINQLAQVLGKSGKEIAPLLERLNPIWDKMFPIEKNRLLRLLVDRVTLYDDHIDIDFRTSGLEQLTEELNYEYDEDEDLA